MLCSLPVFNYSLCYPQSNQALVVLIPGCVCVCVCSRTLWVSPMSSPVRLGVAPAAASTPTGVFNQRSEALFPRAGTLGCVVCHQVHQLLPRRPSAALPTHSTVCHLAGSASHCLAVSPLRLGWPNPPTGLDNVSSLSPWFSDFHKFDFLSVLVVFCF